MTIVYDFGNSQSWQYFWSGTETAQAVPLPVLNQYYPIPNIVVPVQLTSTVIAVKVDTTTEIGSRRYAGRAFYQLGTGITAGGLSDSLASSRRIYLNQINVLRFERLSTNWTLVFEIPWWIRQVSLEVWEYTGLIENTLETQLEEIKALLEQGQNSLPE